MVSTFVVKSCLWGLSKTAKKKLLPNTYYLCAIKYIVMKSFFNEHSKFLAPVYMRYFLNFRLISKKCYINKVQIRSQNLKIFPLSCLVTKRVIFSNFFGLLRISELYVMNTFMEKNRLFLKEFHHIGSGEVNRKLKNINYKLFFDLYKFLCRK